MIFVAVPPPMATEYIASMVVVVSCAAKIILVPSGVSLASSEYVNVLVTAQVYIYYTNISHVNFFADGLG